MKNSLITAFVKMIGNSKVPATPGFESSHLKVAISTSDGEQLGEFPVFVNNGQRYIYFNNNWVYIQSRNRFANQSRWFNIANAVLSA